MAGNGFSGSLEVEGLTEPGSEGFEHLLGTADIELHGLFDGHMRDGPVIDDQCEALSSSAESDSGSVHFKTQGLCEFSVSIGQQCDVVSCAPVFRPGVHDKGVVDGHAGDDINALGLDVGGVTDEPWKMLLGAGGCEGNDQ